MSFVQEASTRRTPEGRSTRGASWQGWLSSMSAAWSDLLQDREVWQAAGRRGRHYRCRGNSRQAGGALQVQGGIIVMENAPL